MKTAIVAGLVPLTLVLAVPARAQDTTRLQITRAESVRSRSGPAEHFTGEVRVQRLFDSTTSTRASGAVVTFAAGARTAWHTHLRGQVLIVTAGVGRVQRWGGPVEEIRPGDVVWIPPGVKHWHGAAPASSMTHIAVVEHSGGRTTEWLEPVSDVQYGAPPRAQGASTDVSAQPRPSQAAIGDFAPKLG